MRSLCVLTIFLFSVAAVSQVSLPRCDGTDSSFSGCASYRANDEGSRQRFAAGGSAAEDSEGPSIEALPANSAFISTTDTRSQERFHWGRALLESFELLAIEEAYVVHDDWRWVAGANSENGVPFNHYWRDYKQSLSTWIHSGWSDGDPNMYGYVGHPIQGLAASYIYLQNDPKSAKLEFSKTKAYWHSRLMATLWNAAYSTQWNIGPISEPTVEKYGTKQRPPWNQNGSWPCTTKNCYTGMGQIDLVMTPVGGFGWLVGEDILDRYITRRVESATQNRFVIDTVRCGLDPIMIGTNLLHGKRPWYRASRDKVGLNALRPIGKEASGQGANTGGSR